MIISNQIKADAPVVCSKNVEFAMVDHMEGSDTIKLKKDKQGQHHYIPLSWVTKVDDKIHVDRSSDRAMKEWSTDPKTKPSDRATTEGAKSTAFVPNQSGPDRTGQKSKPEPQQTAR